MRLILDAKFGDDLFLNFQEKEKLEVKQTKSNLQKILFLEELFHRTCVLSHFPIQYWRIMNVCLKTKPQYLQNHKPLELITILYDKISLRFFAVFGLLGSYFKG